MRINPQDTIAGLPVLTVRRFFRQSISGFWGRAHVARRLNISEAQAEHIIQEFLMLELIKPAGIFEGEACWSCTAKAVTLASTSARRTMSRKAADRLIREVLERAVYVNRSGSFLYCVSKVLLFGSALTDTEEISDIDLAVALVPCEANEARFAALCEQRIREAHSQQRKFATYLDPLRWSQNEVLLFLKDRSAAIRMHSIDDPILERTATKVIYEYSGS
jgi:hypothetical protein